MQFIEQPIKGVWEIRLRPIEDKRGYFMRAYDKSLLQQHGIHHDWVQENQALSTQMGTLRGLHFQFPPHAETKLVRVIRGAIFDVFVDLREDSPTFGQWGGIHLSAAQRNMAYIPKGFAHGYCTCSEEAEVLYKVDSAYAPDHEGGIKWDDPELGIQWPSDSPIISEKDRQQPSFASFCEKYTALNPTI